MSDNQKYYYLKLKENFFDGEQLIILESMPDGYLYSNILLKLYLRSVKNNGKLMFNETIPYNSTVLSQVVRHPVGVVEKAIKVFESLGLIEVLDNGAIYMLEIQNYIGKSSDEADRKREYRSIIENEKRMLGQMSDKCPDKSPPKIEIELDIEKKINKKNIDDFFESVWKLYPLKKGKASVSDKTKKSLYSIGFDTLKVCIDRYVASKEEWKQFKEGSTFFNGGYVDYLDENYQEPENKETTDRYDNPMFRAIGRGSVFENLDLERFK